MGCFILLFSLIGPRFALGFLWLFTGFVDRAYDNMLLPALGFVFLPWTTFTYALAYDGEGVSSIGWFFVALAAFGDVSSFAAARRGQQMQYA